MQTIESLKQSIKFYRNKIKSRQKTIQICEMDIDITIALIEKTKEEIKQLKKEQTK